jgi:hypothetical protein
MLNFRVELNARDRLVIWGQCAKELCEDHNLRLIDRAVGLVDSTVFEELVKRSFAWQCFLDREKAGT